MPLRTPDYSFDPDALRRRDHAAHAAPPAELAAQPDRQGVLARRARARSPSSRVEHDLARRHRRGLRAPRVRRRARPARDAARDARPHGHDLVGRQDVLVHRWKVGWAVRAPRARRRGADREAVPHLRERRAVPVRDRGRARPRRRLLRRVPSPSLREKRDRLCAGLGRRRLRRRSRRPAPTSSPPTSARSARPTTARVLPRAAASAAASSRSRASCSTTTRSAGAPLVRFACCKRLDVLDDAVARLKALWPTDEGRRHPARHRVGGPAGELRAPRAADRRRPRPAAPASSCCTEMYSTGFSMDDRAHRRAGRRPEHAVPRRAGARARRLGVRVGARCAAAATRGRPTGSCSPAPDGALAPLRQDPSVHLRRRARALRRGRRRSSPSTSKACACSFFVCYDLRFADEFWALAPDDRLLRRRRELARGRGARTGARCCARARSRTRRTSSASTASATAAARVRGRLDDRRPVRRGARDRGATPRRSSRATSIPPTVEKVRAEFPFLHDRR